MKKTLKRELNKENNESEVKIEYKEIKIEKHKE